MWRDLGKKLGSIVKKKINGGVQPTGLNQKLKNQQLMRKGYQEQTHEKTTERGVGGKNDWGGGGGEGKRLLNRGKGV